MPLRPSDTPTPRAGPRGPRGHLWTVGALARRSLRPSPPLPGERFTGTVEDPVTGPQPLSGWLSRPPAARRLVVLLHGLGGSPDSAYMRLLAATAHRAGLASLRLGLRGAGGRGDDFYHGGLTADLAAALAEPALDGFEEVLLAGLSLGGHVALRYARGPCDPRIRAVAAVSSPLDLAAGADAIDSTRLAVYRWFLLRGLRPHGERASRAGILSTPPEVLRQVRTLRQWDSLTVVPRYGFADASDYYNRASVGAGIADLRCPALLLVSAEDPMVPPRTIEPVLAAAGHPAALEVRWAQPGGHLAFSPALDLGIGGEPGWPGQIVAWLERHGGAPA